MSITTHVLDTSVGSPARGVAVVLERDLEGCMQEVGRSVTDDDGRARDLSQGPLEVGSYRLTFDTGPYFAARGVDAFYPNVTVTFRVTSGAQHYHVPLLLNPFGYSTYRGS